MTQGMMDWDFKVCCHYKVEKQLANNRRGSWECIMFAKLLSVSYFVANHNHNHAAVQYRYQCVIMWVPECEPSALPWKWCGVWQNKRGGSRWNPTTSVHRRRNSNACSYQVETVMCLGGPIVIRSTKSHVNISWKQGLRCWTLPGFTTSRTM